MIRIVMVVIVLSLFPVQANSETLPALKDPREVHLAKVKQLTFGGENAEAYFSDDGKKLIFQSTRPPGSCDQIFIMNADGSDVKLLSTGQGATSCSFLFPGGKRFLYASTHLEAEACPPEKTGLKKGDVVTAMNGKTVMGLRDLSDTLKSLKAGDRVRVELLRGEEKLKLEAILQKR